VKQNIAPNVEEGNALNAALQAGWRSAKYILIRLKLLKKFHTHGMIQIHVQEKTA
jgi:hypothetical protein